MTARMAIVFSAEHRRAQVVSLDESGRMPFKIHQDPRVTRAGSRLRPWSPDELLHLVNVLSDEMSLEGPRPILPEEATQCGDYMRCRLVRRRIIGLLQINDRSDLARDQAVLQDMPYVANWSFHPYLQVLWKAWSAIHADAAPTDRRDEAA